VAKKPELSLQKLQHRAKDTGRVQAHLEQEQLDASAVELEQLRAEMLQRSADEMTLEELTTLLQRAHESCSRFQASATEAALVAGRVLLELRQRVKGQAGGFTGWLREHAPGMSQRTAYRYAALAEYWPRIQSLSEFANLANSIPLTDAYAAIAQIQRQDAIAAEVIAPVPQQWVKARPTIEMLQAEWDALDHQAERQGISRDELILRIVKTWLNRHRP
jgi:hypothetical protein